MIQSNQSPRLRRSLALVTLCSGSALIFAACDSFPTLEDGGRSRVSGDGDGLGGSGANNDITVDLGGGATGEGGAGKAPPPEEDEPACGDGNVTAGEQCDDGNTEAGDGCTQLCSQEAYYDCSTPGSPCRSLVVCGDSKRVGPEECDDGNSRSGDGCSATCESEAGYDCAVPGAPCKGICGDGVLAVDEQCDDDGVAPGDGCSATCLIESDTILDGSDRPRYWACPTEGEACVRATCGDGNHEGIEPCDDGNDRPGDGCSPTCDVEPSCTGGSCSSSCGDGIIIPGDDEECDDGNTLDGDGCDSTCHAEPGWTCSLTQGALPDELYVPVVYRDFIARPDGGSSSHSDFQRYGGQGTPGMVNSSLSNGVPVASGNCLGNPGASAGCPHGNQAQSAASFAEWYTDVPGTNLTIVDQLCLQKLTGDSYQFDSRSMNPEDCTDRGNNNGLFIPLTGRGWPAAGMETENQGNGGFTSAITTWFEYKGGETLEFSGDDDVWVFINDTLVLDLGGMHSRREGSVVLDGSGSAHATADFGTPGETALGLVIGRIYPISVFQAERQFPTSNYMLTLSGFQTSTSTCETDCGDGIRAGDEACDEGGDNQAPGSPDAYGACTTSCTFGPYCGDGVAQTDNDEVCDTPAAVVNYSADADPSACTAACVRPGYCGDGVIDSAYGEDCDEGEDGNDGGHNECNSRCRLDEYCGDGVVQDDEECDDGSGNGAGACTLNCTRRVVR